MIQRVGLTSIPFAVGLRKPSNSLPTITESIGVAQLHVLLECVE
jgi:hypothetical protein